MPVWADCACRLPIMDRCTMAKDCGPVTFDLDLGNVVDTLVTKIFVLVWPICDCGLPMRGRCAWAWKFGPGTFELGAMTLTLVIL